MPTRKLETNTYYHVYNRSFNHIKIFRTSEDPLRFKRKIKCYTKKHKVIIKSFAIMDTHYHFLISQSEKTEIPSFIKALQISHTKYFNLKYNRKGRLFTERYKAKPTTTFEYYKNIKKYILCNPIDKALEIEINDLSSSNLPF